MNVKEEVRRAKEKAQVLKNEGKSLNEIMHLLNVEFDGFYHIVKDQIVRDQEQDYLPHLVIA